MAKKSREKERLKEALSGLSEVEKELIWPFYWVVEAKVWQVVIESGCGRVLGIERLVNRQAEVIFLLLLPDLVEEVKQWIQ